MSDPDLDFLPPINLDHADLGDTQSRDEWQARRNVQYARQILRKILTRLQLGPIRALEQRCRECTGQAELNFAWFNLEYPTFPMYLDTRFIPYVHQVTLIDLQDRFTRTSIFRAYQDFRDGLPDAYQEAAAGLIFHWPDLGDFIIHSKVPGLANFSILWQSDRHQCVLERFFDRPQRQGVLGALQSLWRP